MSARISLIVVPLALIFYQLYSLVLGRWLGTPQWIDAMFAGFIIGYVCYDMIHYATHHLPMRWGPLKAIKRYHMLHHYKTPNERFGVSTPGWDVVFGTLPTGRLWVGAALIVGASLFLLLREHRTAQAAS